MNLNSIAYTARAELVASQLIISLGHVQQLVAAGLGYNSMAAFQTSSEEKPGIGGATFWIIDKDCIASRAARLAVGDDIEKIVNAIIVGIASQKTTPRVFRSVDEFFEDVLSDFIRDEIFHHDAVNTASAETNAYFSDSFAELADTPEALSNVVSTWDVPITGVVNMDQDPDKMFFGDRIQFSGVVRMKKAGRVCLTANMELAISASVDDDYYDRPEDIEIADAAR